MATLRREMWGDQSGGNINRWTVESAPLPHGTEMVVVVHGVLTVRNDLREIANSNILEFPFKLAANGAEPLTDEYWNELRHLSQAGISTSDLDEWKPQIQKLWITAKDQVEAYLERYRSKAETEFSAAYKLGMKNQIAEERQIFKLRIKELEASQKRDDKALSRVKKELVAAEMQRLQLTFSDEENKRRRDRLRQVKEQFDEALWQRQHNVIELLKKRLEGQRDRILNEVLPRRFKVTSVEVQPVGVQFLVSNQETSHGH